MTIGNYPRKLDEYLALGKPVVATLTEAMKSFEGQVYLCSTSQEFLDAIQFSIEEDPLAGKYLERRNFAFSHTWDISLNKMDNFILNYLKNKKY